MTIQILFIQGGGAGAEDDWDSKLVASILIESARASARR
jgi:hypothetical protein